MEQVVECIVLHNNWQCRSAFQTTSYLSHLFLSVDEALSVDAMSRKFIVVPTAYLFVELAWNAGVQVFFVKMSFTSCAARKLAAPMTSASSDAARTAPVRAGFRTFRDGPNKGGRDLGTLKRALFPMMTPRTVESTSKADYVHHQYIEPTHLAVKDASSVLTQDQVNGKFQAMTCYSDEYTTKTTDRPKPCVAKGPLYSQHFLHHAGGNASTTYGDYFVRHSAERHHHPDIRSSTLTAQSTGRRFEGQTSYGKYYGKPEPQQQPQTARESSRDNQSTLTDATRSCFFDSQSIYSESFLKHRLRPQPNCRPLDSHDKFGFSGTSEYRSVYTSWPRPGPGGWADR